VSPGPGPSPAQVRRGRRLLLLIAALFLGPLVLAALSYYGGALLPAGRVNHGELVSPARPLPELRLALPGGATTAAALLRGKWSLLWIGAAGCEGQCRAALRAGAMVRRALGADARRLQQVVLIDATCCERRGYDVDPGIVVAWLDGAARERLVATLPAVGAGPAEATYLIDPLGNLVLRYPAGADPHGMLADLERLLRLSQIG
jgi:cytochrome oxidase Cu insertion factor (SCO1/SenC/PrrC family)